MVDKRALLSSICSILFASLCTSPTFCFPSTSSSSSFLDDPSSLYEHIFRPYHGPGRLFFVYGYQPNHSIADVYADDSETQVRLYLLLTVLVMGLLTLTLTLSCQDTPKPPGHEDAATSASMIPDQRTIETILRHLMLQDEENERRRQVEEKENVRSQRRQDRGSDSVWKRRLRLPGIFY